MHSKLQFDIDEQNKAVISFKKSSDTEDVRDKMAKRFFESVDHNSFLRLEYDHTEPAYEPGTGILRSTKLTCGTLFPVTEHEILGYLSQEINPHKELSGDNIAGTYETIAVEEGEDPRIKIFEFIKEKANITDFHTLLKLSQLIGYKMGTTPFHNYGYDPQKIVFSIVLEQEREYFPIEITGRR